MSPFTLTWSSRFSLVWSFFSPQLVDMHQGPSNTSTNDHEMAGLRIQEITNAHQMSLGPFFVVRSNICTTFLPYSDKREKLLKITFLVNEQNVSVMYIDINVILTLDIFQQDECFCSKLGMEVEYAESNLRTSHSQIWEICQVLPFVRVGQICPATIRC